MEISPEQIQFIMERLATINDEMGGVQTDIAVLKVQVNELLWMVRGIIGAFIVIFAKQFIHLIKIKNNK